MCLWQGSPRAGHSAKNVSDLIYERHQQRLAPGRAVLATASLNPPAGRPGGDALQNTINGDALKPSNPSSRHCEAEAKHAARLASTSAGARAAAVAALRASRRRAAARLPSAHTAAHDSASQTADADVRDSASQTGGGAASTSRQAVQPFDVRPATRQHAGPIGTFAQPLSGSHRGPVSETDGLTSSAAVNTAWLRTESQESAGAPTLPLTLPSPSRRRVNSSGRSPVGELPSDLALQMGLPPSPQLPARHQRGVPHLSHGELCTEGHSCSYLISHQPSILHVPCAP